MFLWMPRKDEWIPSLLNEGLEILEMNAEKIKTYLDIDLSRAIVPYLENHTEHKQHSFNDLEKCVAVEGLVNQMECIILESFELGKGLLLDSKQHTFLLAKEGFFGDDNDRTTEQDSYWIRYYLSEEISELYLHNEILPLLKDIRLSSLFKE
jgi:hypothetical protein